MGILADVLNLHFPCLRDTNSHQSVLNPLSFRVPTMTMSSPIQTQPAETSASQEIQAQPDSETSSDSATSSDSEKFEGIQTETEAADTVETQAETQPETAKTEERSAKRTERCHRFPSEFYTRSRFPKNFRELLEEGWVGVGNPTECTPLSPLEDSHRCYYQANQEVTDKIGRPAARAHRYRKRSKR